MNFKKYSAWAAVVCVLSTGIVSCNKNEKDASSVTLAGTTLAVRVAGIGDGTYAKSDISVRSGLQASAQSAAAKQTDAKPKLISSGNFDVLVDIQSPVSAAQNAGSGLKATTGSALRASSNPMVAGSKYRLLLYKVLDNTLVSNTETSAGTSPVVQVQGGQSYKWYAFSTNEATTPDVDAAGNVMASAIANKDVLYAAGTFNAVAGENNLDIVFKRHTSRIAVNLNVRGLFGTVNGSTAIELGTGATAAEFNSVVQTGDLNLLTGEYSNLQSVPAIVGDAMQNKTDNGGAAGATKTAFFYSVKPMALAANTLKVRLKKLDITLDDDASIRSFVGVTIPSGNSNVDAAIGSTHTVNLNLIEPAVAVKNVLWARTNLFYQQNAPDRYKFRMSNDKNPDVNVDYWRALSDTPTGSGSSIVVADPCAKVYPLGTWRMPTSAEFMSLGNPDSYTKSTFTDRTSVWNTSSTANPAYPASSQNLKLPYFGHRQAGTIVGYKSPISIIIVTDAQYWTSGVNTLNSVTAQEYWQQNYQKKGALGETQTNPSIASENAALDFDGGRNIRCVRASK
ncbi:MAG: hypothetical protein K0R59_200 [Sphingobacterium sp.]|nr:hypothetical protein [Sphingobacterium sp.]